MMSVVDGYDDYDDDDDDDDDEFVRRLIGYLQVYGFMRFYVSNT